MCTPPSGAVLLTASVQTGESSVIDMQALTRRQSGLPAGAVTACGFSPDGRWLITVDLAGDLTLRGPSNLEAIRTFQGDSGAANTFAAGDEAGPRTAQLTDRWVQYWRFDPDAWPETACRLARRNLTRAEWDQFGPRDQPYRATCAQWPSA